MSQKKHHKAKESQPEEAGEVNAEAVESPEISEQAMAEIDALRRQLEDSEAKLAESVDGWQRSAAEFQNYKKRIERERDFEKAMMKGDIIKKVLPVLDDLERALQNRPADDAWSNGIELIARKVQNIIEAEGVKRIEAEGAAFDPNFHEAISNEPSEEVESGHVIAVVQNGYMLGERVLRPAMVRVAQ